MPSFALTGLLGLSEDWKLARSTFSTATSIAIPGTTNTALTPTTHPGLVRNNMAGSESRIHPAPGMLIMPVGADAADEIFRMEVYGAKRYPTSGNDDQFIFTQFLVCTACVICTYTLTFLQADTFACDDLGTVTGVQGVRELPTIANNTSVVYMPTYGFQYFQFLFKADGGTPSESNNALYAFCDDVGQ